MKIKRETNDNHPDKKVQQKINIEENIKFFLYKNTGKEYD